jgi:uncharacterized protein YidB (DUF937 family)
MGLFDELLNQVTGAQAGASAPTSTSGLAGVAATLAQNPQVLAALGSLLSPRDASVGGGGLQGLVAAFQQKGMGDMIGSWISTGPNPPVSAAQLTDVLGDQTIAQFASKAGVPPSQAGSLLAGLLPAAIDHLTPDGTLPDAGGLESALASLFAR